MASPNDTNGVEQDADFVQFLMALRSLSNLQRQAVTDLFGLMLDHGIDMYEQLCACLPFLHAVLTRVDPPSADGMTRADVMFGRALRRRREVLREITRRRSSAVARSPAENDTDTVQDSST
ncbi:hypothetical protein VNI00_008954 [Paramarasmius palmivorus]|uniref:Uncharacterized protein n=1 Tax=Paramarasmius palmivorus TaxID=297713 RepID=A0AAW0CS73_9AGAR